MKKTLVMLAGALAILGNLMAKTIPLNQQMTFHNKTPHALFIVEKQSYKELKPKEGIVVGWSKNLSKRPRTVSIYYGGKTSHKKIPAQGNHKKLAASAKPIELATIEIKQPGTISFFYNKNGTFTFKEHLDKAIS